MIIVEHAEDRCSPGRANVSADIAVTGASSVESAGIVRASA
jgi:hypothetical protein